MQFSVEGLVEESWTPNLETRITRSILRVASGSMDMPALLLRSRPKITEDVANRQRSLTASNSLSPYLRNECGAEVLSV